VAAEDQTQLDLLIEQNQVVQVVGEAMDNQEQQELQVKEILEELQVAAETEAVAEVPAALVAEALQVE
jgi:hypothetical protein